MSPLVDLERMKARLAKLDAEREPLLALIRAAEAYESVVGRTLFTYHPDGRVGRRDDGPGRAAPLMEATDKAVTELLTVMERPLSTSDIAELLSDRPELNLASKNRVNVLSARLSNSEKFKTRRGVGWWFKDKPWPDGQDDDPSGETEPSPQDNIRNFVSRTIYGASDTPIPRYPDQNE